MITERYTDHMIPQPSGERPGAQASGRADPSEGMATPSQPGDSSASRARALARLDAIPLEAAMDRVDAAAARLCGWLR